LFVERYGVGSTLVAPIDDLARSGVGLVALYNARQHNIETPKRMKTALKVTRQQDFAEWYQQVIKAADLAENAEVRGCMNIKPWGYAIWENIQQRFDKLLKATGHRNAYFPLLIPLRFFQQEAQHVEGFAKECAVVTHHRLALHEGTLVPDPDSKLEEPLVIRPTSETIIGDAFSRWIQSPKDLPLLINQWCNVMRWEMRTRLFLRTSEFLWQEGHTAHATSEEAIEEARLILQMYKDFVTDALCIPVIVGEKSAGERFPGAVNTWSIEGMMQDGKALQAGTSHFLGQNFSRAYKIKFGSSQGEQFVWTTSWGISTRLIGGLIMTHSDDNGLVLPPAISPVHLRVLLLTEDPAEAKRLRGFVEDALAQQATNVCGEPLRTEYLTVGRRPGDSFWVAVKQGVPAIAQVGLREMDSGSISLTLRTDPQLQRQSVSHASFLATLVTSLEDMQVSLRETARAFREKNLVRPENLEALKAAFSDGDISPFALCPVDVAAESEEFAQLFLKEHKLSFRCLPEGELGILAADAKCIFTGRAATHVALLAKSY